MGDYWWSHSEAPRRKVNMKVEYESTPIRHLAVQCPECNFWFFGDDIFEEHCGYDYQIHMARGECPKCGCAFEVASDSNIEESNEFPEFYDKCLHRKVSWE